MTIPLRICAWNANGILLHKHEVELLLQLHKIDVMLLTETHLTDGARFRFTNYTLIAAHHPSGASTRGRCNTHSQQTEILPNLSDHYHRCSSGTCYLAQCRVEINYWLNILSTK